MRSGFFRKAVPRSNRVSACTARVPPHPAQWRPVTSLKTQLGKSALPSSGSLRATYDTPNAPRTPSATANARRFLKPRVLSFQHCKSGRKQDRCQSKSTSTSWPFLKHSWHPRYLLALPTHQPVPQRRWRESQVGCNTARSPGSREQDSSGCAAEAPEGQAGARTPSGDSARLLPEISHWKAQDSATRSPARPATIRPSLPARPDPWARPPRTRSSPSACLREAGPVACRVSRNTNPCF